MVPVRVLANHLYPVSDPCTSVTRLIIANEFRYSLVRCDKGYLRFKGYRPVAWAVTRGHYRTRGRGGMVVAGWTAL